MRIKALQNLRVADGAEEFTAKAGDVLECADRAGARLIRLGWAEKAEKKAAKKPAGKDEK